jgi:hypothetical protein
MNHMGLLLKVTMSVVRIFGISKLIIDPINWSPNQKKRKTHIKNHKKLFEIPKSLYSTKPLEVHNAAISG